KDLSAEKRKLVDPGLLDAADQGKKFSMLEILDAQHKRGALGAHMNLFHRDYDLLLTPALSIVAFDAGKNVADSMLPCGLTRAGLPVGLQIVGPRYADARVLRAARAFESARPFALPDLRQL
ncbi:MAG: amidase, partial [Betaproteobacteria bacterium]